MQPPHYQKLSIFAHFRTSGQTCENTAFSVLKKPRRLRVGWGPSAQVRLPAPQGCTALWRLMRPLVWVRLPTPRRAHHSVAADEAAGVGEAVGPAVGVPLCGGG